MSLAYRGELIGREHGQLPAALAVEILALVAADERIEARAVAEVDVAGQPVAFEHLEVAVYRGLLERQRLGQLCADTGPEAANSASMISRRAVESRSPDSRSARIASTGIGDHESGGVGGEGHRAIPCRRWSRCADQRSSMRP